jgi:HAD superfamily hydrolase (TIGR01459 family)
MTLLDVSAKPQTATLAALAGRYDVLLVDLWGTIHDGVRPYDGAREALQRLREAGARVVFLSNVPRRNGFIVEMLANMGIARALYHAAVAAGESAWQALARRDDPFHAALGARVFHFGPERNAELVAGNGLTVVASPAEAEFVLCSAAVPDAAPLSAQIPALEAIRARGLKMICANPDLTVMRGDEVRICAGMIVREYEKMGGEAHYHGKPYRRIYDLALEVAGNPPPARVLAIGDTPATDVAGAAALGMDTALIPGGIHGAELGVAMGEIPDPAAYARFIAAQGVRPTWLLPSFRW